MIDDQLNEELARIAVVLDSQRVSWQKEANERPLPSLLLSVIEAGGRDLDTEQDMRSWSIFIEAGAQPRTPPPSVSTDSGAVVSVSFQSRAIFDAVRAGTSTLQSAFLNGEIRISGAHEECWFVSQVMSSVWS